MVGAGRPPVVTRAGRPPVVTRAGTPPVVTRAGTPPVVTRAGRPSYLYFSDIVRTLKGIPVGGWLLFAFEDGVYGTRREVADKGAFGPV